MVCQTLAEPTPSSIRVVSTTAEERSRTGNQYHTEKRDQACELFFPREGFVEDHRAYPTRRDGCKERDDGSFGEREVLEGI